mmetsp:Transcript_28297/g.76660  ORF Transcript_28297/g.76660 Transcript_28297/m.76660 type:complete len:218 (+) Transcript_28297:115-768(+)
MRLTVPKQSFSTKIRRKKVSAVRDMIIMLAVVMVILHSLIPVMMMPSGVRNIVRFITPRVSLLLGCERWLMTQIIVIHHIIRITRARILATLQGLVLTPTSFLCSHAPLDFGGHHFPFQLRRVLAEGLTNFFKSSSFPDFNPLENPHFVSLPLDKTYTFGLEGGQEFLCNLGFLVPFRTYIFHFVLLDNFFELHIPAVGASRSSSATNDIFRLQSEP